MLTKPQKSRELSKSDCLAIGIDSLSKIRFCEALRHDLMEQDQSSQMATRALQKATEEIHSLTTSCFELSARSHALARELKDAAEGEGGASGHWTKYRTEAGTVATQIQTAVKSLAQVGATLIAAAPHLLRLTRYLQTTSDRTSNLYVLGQAYESLVTQLGLHSAPRPEPGARFVELVEQSHFLDPQRFTKAEPETILMDGDVLISMTDL